MSLFWCCFCTYSCGAGGFPLRVLPQVTLRGFRNLSGSSCLSCSCGGALLWGLQCLWCAAWFSTLCRALPPGPAVCAAYPTAGYPWGVLCLFCHRVPDLLLLWWRRLGGNPSLIFCASPAPAGLQGFAGFCTLCQGAPFGVVSALWVTVSWPCWLSLTLGWVRFWPAVSVSCEVCSLGCPSWFVVLFMSLFVLHLLLGWGGLVTGLWPHLQLLCVGLFWCLCSAVLTPWLLVVPSSFSCASLGFFLWCLLDLGW